MTPVRIDDPDDPRVAAYRDVRERDLAGRRGEFIAEGEVVLAKLVASARHRPASVLIAEKRIVALKPILSRLDDTVPVYAAGQAVMDAIAGFPIHRGILAVGRREPPVTATNLLAGLPDAATVVVLSGIANHDNMGGVFRNAAAFGAAAVILDPTCCDPLYRKAIRVSVGAALTVPFARLGPGEGVAAVLTAAGFEAFALSPSGAETLAELTPPGRAALVFGAEGPGLAPDLLARIRTVRLPMAGGFDSLNVATTSGIVLHHFAAGRSPPERAA